jgi:hypothetical protein
METDALDTMELSGGGDGIGRAAGQSGRDVAFPPTSL